MNPNQNPVYMPQPANSGGQVAPSAPQAQAVSPNPAAVPQPPTPVTTPPGQANGPAPIPEAKKPAKSKKGVSTQDAVLISEIRDGLVIMRDGSLRAVVMCRSINFDLMSPQEREAVEFSYQGFLNSLYFPIQVFIRSQRVDLKNYINKLEQIHSNQENVLLGLLMEDYIAYVRYLIEAANVMDKQFYVVISYYPPLLSPEGISKGVKRISTLFRSKPGPIAINEADYARYKSELSQRVQIILEGMNQMGVQAVPLNTQELIELYYAAYNPDTATKERLTNTDQLETPIIEKGTGRPPQTAEEQNGTV